MKLLRKFVDDKNVRVWRAAAMVLLKISRTDEKCRVENVRNGLIEWMHSMVEEQAMAELPVVSVLGNGKRGANDMAKDLPVAPVAPKTEHCLLRAPKSGTTCQ